MQKINNMIFVIGVVAVVISALFGCSKGNTLTGNSVADTAQGQTADSDGAETPEPAGNALGEVGEDDIVLGDVEPPDYSNLAGTCNKDSTGTVRVIDEEGTKTVYRPDCLADRLVEYGCDGNTLTTKMIDCERCVEDRAHVARCE